MPAPAVTVCIPTYNYGHYLGGAIASVLDQTFGDFELLIADDASSDDTNEVVQRFLGDPRVSFLPNESNKGMFANFNRCIELAGGRYIKFLMADDWLAPECLERSVELLEANPAVNVVTTASWQIDEEGEVFASEFQFPFAGRVVDRTRVIDQFGEGANAVGMPSGVLLRTESLRAAGGFDADYAPAADVDLWFRMLGDSDLGWIDQRLALLRIHRAHTHDWGDDPHESWLRVWRDAPERSNGLVTQQQLDFALRRWSTKHSTFASKYLLAGSPRRARELWRIAGSEVGFWPALGALIGSLPQTLRARRILRSAKRQAKMVEYHPQAEIGADVSAELALVAETIGPRLREEITPRS